MPKEEHKLTLNDELYQKAEQKAKEEHKSVDQFVTDLIEMKTEGV